MEFSMSVWMYEKCFISGENECQYECMENVLFVWNHFCIIINFIWDKILQFVCPTCKKKCLSYIFTLLMY